MSNFIHIFKEKNSEKLILLWLLQENYHKSFSTLALFDSPFSEPIMLPQPTPQQKSWSTGLHAFCSLISERERLFLVWSTLAQYERFTIRIFSLSMFRQVNTFKKVKSKLLHISSSQGASRYDHPGLVPWLRQRLLDSQCRKVIPLQSILEGRRERAAWVTRYYKVAIVSGDIISLWFQTQQSIILSTSAAKCAWLSGKSRRVRMAHVMLLNAAQCKTIQQKEGERARRQDYKQTNQYK